MLSVLNNRLIKSWVRMIPSRSQTQREVNAVRKISLFILLVSLVTGGSLQARSLSLGECIDKALHTHPDIQRFVLQVGFSEKGIEAARADYLPQIFLNAEYDPTRTYVLPVNGVFDTRDSDGWQAGITVQQKIWDFNKTKTLIRVQESQAVGADLSLADARALLAYKVKLQYELVQVQRKATEVRQKDLEVKKALHAQAQALVNQGLRTKADETRFISATAMAQDNLAMANANLVKALSTLSLYIGEPLPPDIILEENIEIQEDALPDEEEVVQRSPVLQGLREKIRQKKLLHKAARAARYGSFDALASYVHQDTLSEYDSTLLGVMFNVPLYTGGRLSAKEEQAFIEQQKAESEYASRELALREELKKLYADLQRYKQTIKAKSRQLISAKQTRNVVSGRYQEGLATYIEVLDATALQLNARLGLLQATYDRSRTLHRLEYLQGKSK